MADEKQLLIEALKNSHDVRFTPGVYEHSIYGKAALLLEKSVEVVHGRWEWITEDIYGCTHCGATNHVKEVMGLPAWDYCPECSADMRERRNQDEQNSVH